MRSAGSRHVVAGTLWIAGLAATTAWAAPPAEPPLDSLQRSVIESLDSTLGLPGGQTPAAFLEAAIRAADVEAWSAARRYLGRLAQFADQAGEQGPELFADLADAIDNSALIRLAGLMDKHEPAAGRLVRAILETGRLRRREPTRLATAAADLASDDRAVRQQAAEQLLGAGVDALPVLVPLLPEKSEEARPASRQRWLARELIARLGNDARQPLLDWLSFGDPADWAGVIEALDVSGATDIEDFLLAPALVADTPSAAKAAAWQVLARRAAARGSEAPSVAGPEAAANRLFARLDRLMTPEGLPPVDCLRLEPFTDPGKAAAAFGGHVEGLVGRLLWNPDARRFDPAELTPRAARSRDAVYLARSLQALDVRAEPIVDLLLLTRLETALVTGGTTAAELERMPGGVWMETLAGPTGFQAEIAGRLLDQAIVRGTWLAATATARTLAADDEPVIAPAGSPGTLPPSVRDSLVRALAVPDAALQFAAARTLALAAGEPPYRGSSRVLEVLVHAATSTGRDRAVVAHPFNAVGQELAAKVAGFGYDPVVVTSGRKAVFAARESADTVVVLVGSRILAPTVIETVQFLQQQPIGDMPAIVVLVDPLDDHGGSRHLTRLFHACRDLEGVAISDRLDSMFRPIADARGGETGPRFPDVVAQAAGPAAVDPGRRAVAASARLARAGEALGLLAALGRRGWDVAAAAGSARRALVLTELHPPAISLLAALGSPLAQEALEQEAVRDDLPPEARRAAGTAFRESVDRYGLLLTSRQLLDAYARYNSAADDTARGAAGDVLTVIEAARRNPDDPFDAPPLESRR